MQVIKAPKLTGVQGAYTPDLEPQVVEPQVVAPQEEKEEPINLLKRQLLGLDENTRKALVAETFAEEIEALANNAKEDGFQQGQTLASQSIEAAVQEEKETLATLIETWTDNVNQSLQEAIWTIEDEESITHLLFEALCQLLTKTLTTPEETRTVLKSVVATYADSNLKEIAVSEAQLGHLKALNAIDNFADDVKVVADEELTPGSYRVSLAAGFVEHQMCDALEQFKRSIEAIGEVEDNA